MHFQQSYDRQQIIHKNAWLNQNFVKTISLYKGLFMFIKLLPLSNWNHKANQSSFIKHL